MSFKGKHLEEDIKREICFIVRNLKNSSLEGKKVNIVKVSGSGGGFFKVYVSSLKGPIYAKQSLKHLNSALGFIRHEISKKLRLKKAPNIKFIVDDSLEYCKRMDELFLKIKKREESKKFYDYF